MKFPSGPPMIPAKILKAVLFRDRYAETVLGDLQEEFLERVERAPLRARLTYWRDAVGIAARYLIEARRREWLSHPRQSGFDNIMDQFLLNTRYAVRRLTKAPFFTLVAILSLGLGIGANTAMFSMVNALILRDLPFEDVETLVDIYEEQDGFSHATLSYPDYEDVRDGTEGWSSRPSWPNSCPVCSSASPPWTH